MKLSSLLLLLLLLFPCLLFSCRRAVENAANTAAKGFEKIVTGSTSNTEPTDAEANLINNEIAKYFYFPNGTTKDAYTKYGSNHKPSIKVYHFQNLSFSVRELSLNESDRKNGIRRRVIYKLTAEQPYRKKSYGKSWSKWQQGGGMFVGSHFNFTLITTSQGVSIERVTPLIRNYTRPSAYDVR